MKTLICRVDAGSGSLCVNWKVAAERMVVIDVFIVFVHFIIIAHSFFLVCNITMYVCSI